jgi:GNAT superfamily N-acetyltransferase
MSAAHPLTDLALSRRLERTEGSANAAFIDARAQQSPEVGAVWRDFGGTYAMFDGVASPLTQTFGLGLFSTPTADQLQELEQFFEERGAVVQHEVSPIADPQLLPLLVERGYHPIELSAVMCQVLPSPPMPPRADDGGLGVRRVTGSEIETWADVAARGWSETPEAADFVRGMGAVTGRAAGTHTFLADLNGVPIAAGAMHVSGGVAILAGASTIPDARRQGAQAALLRTRLRYAAVQGCDLAMMCALPGSPSQRNAERKGFRIAYTRIKWSRGEPKA